LKIVLVLVELIFLFGVYPLMMFLWSSGWRWQPTVGAWCSRYRPVRRRISGRSSVHQTRMRGTFHWWVPLVENLRI